MKGESVRASGISLRIVAAALTIIAIAGCAGRQQSSAQPQNEQNAASSSSRQVKGLCNLPDSPPADLAHTTDYRQFAVSVTDKSGRPFPGLKQNDFVVSEESKNFPVAYFRENQNDEPLAIALVVDTSGSMTPKLPTVEKSLGNLVENLNRCDEVMLMAFSSRPYLLLPLSTNHKIAATRIGLFRAYGQTALYDATKAALQSLADADYPNRRLILITDGMDNSSAASQEEVVAEAKTYGVPIYAIGIGEPNSPGTHSVIIGPFVTGGAELDRVDAQSLKALTAAAGGRTFIVPGTLDDGGNGFMNAISTIADTIGRGYSIGAVVPKDVALAEVKVAVVNRPDLVVRAHLMTTEPHGD